MDAGSREMGSYVVDVLNVLCTVVRHEGGTTQGNNYAWAMFDATPSTYVQQRGFVLPRTRPGEEVASGNNNHRSSSHDDSSNTRSSGSKNNDGNNRSSNNDGNNNNDATGDCAPRARKACCVTIFMDGECMSEDVFVLEDDALQQDGPPRSYRSISELEWSSSPFSMRWLQKVQVYLPERDEDYMHDIGSFLTRKLPSGTDVWLNGDVFQVESRAQDVVP